MIALTSLLSLLPLVAQPSESDGDYIVERGEGLETLSIPHSERLSFRVRIDLGMIEPAIGSVVMESGVEAFRPSLLLAPKQGDEGAESAWVRLRARGDYKIYSMDTVIESRVFPQEWPRLAYRFTQTGTEYRRREILMGLREGEHALRYRGDTRKGAPKGSRIWKEPEFRSVPQGTQDLVTAVYLARTMITSGEQELVFPLIDKTDLWQMRITRGPERRIETDAGWFDAVLVVLEPGPYPGEEIEEDDQENIEKFEGLFGLKGSIRLWVERNTGVPVRISGDLPIGPLTLGVDVILKGYSGTPEAFVPSAPEGED